MSFGAQTGIDLGSVSVFTTDNRSATIDELADRAIDKIIYVSDTAPPVIREQAQAFRVSIRAVLVAYMREAVRADRQDLVRKHPEFAPILDL